MPDQIQTAESLGQHLCGSHQKQHVRAGTTAYALLCEMVELGASDLHITTGTDPLTFRVGNQLHIVDETRTADVLKVVAEIVAPDQVEARVFMLEMQTDFDGDLNIEMKIECPEGVTVHRFRGTLWHKRNDPLGDLLTIRRLPTAIEGTALINH